MWLGALVDNISVRPVLDQPQPARYSANSQETKEQGYA